MANTKEQQLQAFARRAVRASRALWPTNVRRAVATGRMAQTRRRLIVTCKYGRWSSLFPTKLKADKYGRWSSLYPTKITDGGRPQGAPSGLTNAAERDGNSPFPTQFRAGGRPQGAPPIILSTPALTKNVIGATVLVGASLVILLAARLWLLCLLFGVVVVAIFALVVIMRMRIARAKGLQAGAQRGSFPGVAGKVHSPDTPMPLEPPLVRVLETFDLSQTNVEHFLDLPEGGNTGGYSLENWKEAQASFPRKVRE